MKFQKLLQKVIQDQVKSHKLENKDKFSFDLGISNDIGKCRNRQELFVCLEDYGYSYNDAVDYIFDIIIDGEVDN